MAIPAAIAAAAAEVVAAIEQVVQAVGTVASAISYVESPVTHQRTEKDAILRYESEWVQMVDRGHGTYWVLVDRSKPGSPAATPEKESPARRGMLPAAAGGPTVTDTGQPTGPVVPPTTGSAPPPSGVLGSQPLLAAPPTPSVEPGPQPAPQSEQARQKTTAGSQDGGAPTAPVTGAPAPAEAPPPRPRAKEEIPIVPPDDPAEAKSIAESFRDPDVLVFDRDEQREHDRKVMFTVNWLIQRSARAHAPGKDPSQWTDAERKKVIAEARGLAATFRKSRSQNLIARDAEYYLIGRASSKHFMDQGWPRHLVLGGGTAVHLGYNGLVFLSDLSGAVGGPYFMRSDAGDPNAPAGGHTWVWAGNEDAARLDESADAKAKGWEGLYVTERSGVARFVGD